MFRCDTMDSMYKAIIPEILLFGDQITTRGLDFKETRFEHLVLTNPINRYITIPERKFKMRFLVGEFIWIMSGQCGVDMINFYNKKMSDYSDNGVYLNGAYGPRLRHWFANGGDFDQVQSCLDRLKKDLYTRQAVMVILEPKLDFGAPTKDIPCNNLLQFMYRNGRLDLCVYVRSNDVLLGFPYDVAEWTLLQEIFACELGVPLGEYHHIVGSLHIYNKDIPKMEAVSEDNNYPLSCVPEMPKDTKLSIVDDLAKIEKQYRETGVYDDSSLKSQYWKDFISNIRK